MSEQYCIRVRVTDAIPRDWRQLKPILGPWVHVRDVDGLGLDFILGVPVERQLTTLRSKLLNAKLEYVAECVSLAEKVDPGIFLALTLGVFLVSFVGKLIYERRH